jgi:hypothetical protein
VSRARRGELELGETKCGKGYSDERRRTLGKERRQIG